MTIWLVGCLAGTLILSATHPPLDTYRVTVTRTERNLYRIEGSRPKAYIKTKRCTENVNREEALLRYEPRALDNVLIFDHRPFALSCDVDSILNESR
jgi:hypothetical protein